MDENQIRIRKGLLHSGRVRQLLFGNHISAYGGTDKAYWLYGKRYCVEINPIML